MQFLHLERFFTLSQQGVLGDEKHIVFECPALQDLRDGMRTPQGDAMMWQDDIIGVARFFDAYLQIVYTSAGPPLGARHLISPELM